MEDISWALFGADGLFERASHRYAPRAAVTIEPFPEEARAACTRAMRRAAASVAQIADEMRWSQVRPMLGFARDDLVRAIAALDKAEKLLPPKEIL